MVAINAQKTGGPGTGCYMRRVCGGGLVEEKKQAAPKADEPAKAMREAARPASLVEKKMNKRMKQIVAINAQKTGGPGTGCYMRRVCGGGLVEEKKSKLMNRAWSRSASSAFDKSSGLRSMG